MVWFCLGAVVYHYAGYPVLLFCLATLVQAKSDLRYLFRRDTRRCSAPSFYCPRVAVLMSAYNEEAVIEAKVKNTVSLDYPPDQLEIMLGLDAPSDSTADRLASVRSKRIEVVVFHTRQGKLAVLRDLARQTSAEVLVFTDANTVLKPDCIKNLVRHFSDPRVGAVSGEETRLVTPGTDSEAESLYWRYESAIKVLENRLNCSLGGNGGVLAVRRSLFNSKQHSIVEDLQIPLDIRYQGHRVVYDPEVVAMEEIAPTFEAQFARRVRIGAGNYQTLFRVLGYLKPSHGLVAFCLFSHKVLRWLVPLFLPLLLLANISLVIRRQLGLLLMAQSVFYMAALLGYVLKKRGSKARIFTVPLHFCSMNIALLIGLLTYLRGRHTLTWRSTPRQMKTESLLDQIHGTASAPPGLPEGPAS